MGWSWPEDLQDRVLKKSVGTCESKPSRSWNTTNPNFVHFPGNPSKLTSHISVIFPKMGGISCPLKNPKWLWSGVFLFFLLKEWLKKRHPHFGASLVRKIHHWIFFFPDPPFDIKNDALHVVHVAVSVGKLQKKSLLHWWKDPLHPGRKYIWTHTTDSL